jgi:hypothetical protein
MQEALQNPHYKKIWEKVNWDLRNPQAKSLEEALEMESKFDDSLLFHTYVNDSRIINSQEFTWLSSEIYGEDKGENVTLGRQITLEDVLMLLGKTFIQTLNGYKFVQLTCEGAFITMQPIEHTLHRIEVILGKPLHEQTPETWEKIANLID